MPERARVSLSGGAVPWVRARCRWGLGGRGSVASPLFIGDRALVRPDKHTREVSAGLRGWRGSSSLATSALPRTISAYLAVPRAPPDDWRLAILRRWLQSTPAESVMRQQIASPSEPSCVLTDGGYQVGGPPKRTLASFATLLEHAFSRAFGPLHRSDPLRGPHASGLTPSRRALQVAPLPVRNRPKNGLLGPTGPILGWTLTRSGASLGIPLHAGLPEGQICERGPNMRRERYSGRVAKGRLASRRPHLEHPLHSHL